MDTLDRIALDRLSLVKSSSPDYALTPAAHAAITAELGNVGVRILNPEDICASLLGSYREIVQHVREKRGEVAEYSPLFKGFPDKLPSFDNAKLRFALGRQRLEHKYWETGEITDDDVRESMDFSHMGWWPASSVPSDVEQQKIDRAVEALKKGDSRVEWTTITLVSEITRDYLLKNWATDCVSSATSLRDDIKEDVEAVLRELKPGIDPKLVTFRENKALLLKLDWENDPSLIQRHEPTPDDLLRLFAALTDSDTSLNDKIKYPKLSKAQRRAVIVALENSPRLSDVFRRRDLWLDIDRGLHVGSYDAPRVKGVFGTLRETRHDYASFGAYFERFLSSDFSVAMELAAAESPATLVRQARRLMRLADFKGRAKEYIDALSASVDRVPLRVLMSAFPVIVDNDATYPRLAFTKRGKQMVINRNGSKPSSESFAKIVCECLSNGICTHISKLESWKGERVFIDPALADVLIPASLRSTAEGLVQVERGTRIPSGTDDANVLRFFVHWKENSSRTDLDLSFVALDEYFNPVAQVSWTHLGDETMVHSGDITSAPDGAEEFIDLNIAKAKENDWRYIMPIVLRFSGETFDQMDEVNVGWMLRDWADSDRKTFDPAAVVNAFELTGAKRVANPILFDLKTDQVLYADIYHNGGSYATVERDGVSIAKTTQLISELRKVRPTVFELALLHLVFRGADVVNERSEATVTFGLDDECTYNALRPEKILSELL